MKVPGVQRNVAIRSARSFRSGGLAWALLVALAAGSVARAGSGDFRGQFTWTSDYVFRGVSHSDEKPALQGGLSFHHDSGLFAGFWGSEQQVFWNGIPEDPGSLEVNVYVGIDRELGEEWAGAATLTRYEYSNSRYTYNEAIVAVRYREQIAASLAYTDSAFGREEPSVTGELSALYPARFHLDLSAAVGYTDLDDAFGQSYSFWKLGVSRTFAQLTVDLGFFGTESAAEEVFGDLADDRLVLSVTAAVD